MRSFLRVVDIDGTELMHDGGENAAFPVPRKGERFFPDYSDETWVVTDVEWSLSPKDRLGSVDLTCEVCIDRLIDVLAEAEEE